MQRKPPNTMSHKFVPLLCDKQERTVSCDKSSMIITGSARGTERIESKEERNCEATGELGIKA
jgi:hypothetical protein